ncbi:MAG TPA: tRNA uridine-5-carboxymethylaminomethyl(34) synthesis enzyme MnmG [Gemmatimonadaceae bacterium]|jgi:tRNA uridine 5-carboxymethylaminomethyl modification enzyme|nr:tRNA uridine-5-carboxymethylaminomethyl(34) synthesis enzyme MnmG [Gemmatimonadaceae bacterium]
MSEATPTRTFDVIVVGGGHAGTEAAVAAARALGAGARVALVTSSLDTIGQMSCNPAIGGVAKGTVVREIDALGGVMGRATDMASIQFRMLNRGKGPAVWAPRAQCDRALYRKAVRHLVESRQGIRLVEGTVRRLLFATGEARVAGVETMAGEQLRARSVVITTGTFLRGRMHIGTDTQISGGRAGEEATTHLAEQIAELGVTTSRFKTGTPPRIEGNTVDRTVLERQDSEIGDFDYSWSAFWRHGNSCARLEQAPCWITFAGAETKAIVATHLKESAMYGGAIGSRGPRYCPSIEDKILRFPDAERHQIFLEPEGLSTTEMYVNGLSTSLPAKVQLAMLQSVPGLERVEMTRPGYAIEYDYYPPTQLYPWLEVRAIGGLFFAGQINGTTGYEEAGAQGVVAGLNAALRASGRDTVTFGRETSYIGVLCDDLVTRGVDEPYRLFTSRSEFRLTVRQDNALRRLSGIGLSLGLYDEHEQHAITRRVEDEARVLHLARETQARAEHVDEQLVAAGSAPLQHPVRVAELAKRQGSSLAALFAATGVREALSRDALITVELELKYAGYFEKERYAAERLRRMGEFALPHDAPYERMRTLSVESRQKLAARRPLSLAQAASVPGVSPADLQNLILEIERSRS